jgi:hypothetical protein
MSNLLKPEVSGKWHPTAVGKSIYNFAFGLPSWGWMLPREGVLGVNHVGRLLVLISMDCGKGHRCAGIAQVHRCQRKE